MTTSNTGALDVPGARLHYKVRGSGPLLLMLQGGDGDADATDGITEGLASRYTVASYDRRGLSRSPVTIPATAPDIATHADDARRLLEALTDEPALAFGASLGALIGLDLVARCQERVRLLVAHEPPAVELLPDPERSELVRAQEEVEEIFRREGAAAAMQRFITIAAADFADRESDVELMRPKPEWMANLEFFPKHDVPAARRYRVDRTALRAASERIVPAAGETSGEGGARGCAKALAELLAANLVEFPGGHSGFVFRPRAFAARLTDLLDDSLKLA